MHEYEGIISGSSNISNLLMLSNTMQVDNVKLWLFITLPPPTPKSRLHAKRQKPPR